MFETSEERDERSVAEWVLRSPRPVQETPGERAVRALSRASLAPRREPLDAVSARALALAVPEELSEREARLLGLAEESAQGAGHPEVGGASRTLVAGYLALACLSWAKEPVAGSPSRDASLIAAIALAATMSANHRHIMGVSHELRDLATRGELDGAARELADLVGAERAPGSESLPGKLERLLARVEARVSRPLRKKQQTAAPEHSQSPVRRRLG